MAKIKITGNKKYAVKKRILLIISFTPSQSLYCTRIAYMLFNVKQANVKPTIAECTIMLKMAASNMNFEAAIYILLAVYSKDSSVLPIKSNCRKGLSSTK